MLELSIKGATAEEVVNQILDFLGCTVGKTVKQAEAPTQEPVKNEVKPVISQAQMEENQKNAPVHEEPAQPTIEEVRAALKELRDKKGREAVKELLTAFHADSLPDLKPEDYLGALARAKMEVE